VASSPDAHSATSCRFVRSIAVVACDAAQNSTRVALLTVDPASTAGCVRGTERRSERRSVRWREEDPGHAAARPAARRPPGPAAVTPLGQLDALVNPELALLARAVGEHLPVELAERVLAVRARRAALEAALGFAATRT
jgi:hypothetical protein